jgi:hypothetical protein
MKTVVSPLEEDGQGDRDGATIGGRTRPVHEQQVHTRLTVHQLVPELYPIGGHASLEKG